MPLILGSRQLHEHRTDPDRGDRTRTVNTAMSAVLPAAAAATPQPLRPWFLLQQPAKKIEARFGGAAHANNVTLS